MDSQATIRTVLADAGPLKQEHRLSEQALKGKLNLRGNGEDPEFVSTVEKTLGITPPLATNTVNSSGKKTIFWLGPDEWLVHLPLDEVQAAQHAMQEALAGQHHAITEVSDYYTVIHLTGPQARGVIASASPFDTRADRFKPGDCAQTRFGHASILLWPLDDTPTYGIQVRWSYAQYVYDYLVQSIDNAQNLKNFYANK